MATRKIRVQVEQRYTKRIHNDLGNAAYHLRKRVAAMDASGEDGGIVLDIMAALTMAAFWLESCFNFVGATKIDGWNERAGFWEKKRIVFAHCGIEDKDERPYSSIAKLKEFRDTLAHGKPQVLSHEAQEVRDFGDMRQPHYLQTAWEEICTVDAVCEFYEDVESLWHKMLESIEMTELEACSHGSRGLTYLGENEPE